MNLIMGALAPAVVFSIFGMVALYNAVVNLDHNIASAKAELDSIGAESTSLNREIISAMSSENIAAVAARDGLVVDSKPQYFPLARAAAPNAKWPIASQ